MAPMFSAANSAYSADTARARPGFAFGPGSITNGEVRVRFARKAKSSAQLRSPHVVRVFDYGESDGALYLGGVRPRQHVPHHRARASSADGRSCHGHRSPQSEA